MVNTCRHAPAYACQTSLLHVQGSVGPGGVLNTVALMTQASYSPYLAGCLAGWY